MSDNETSPDGPPVTVSFRTIAHFFDPDDPSPEDCRELSERAEETIYKTVVDRFPGGRGKKNEKRLEIVLPAADITKDREKTIPKATRAHFALKEKELSRDMEFTVREGLREFRLTTLVCVFLFSGIAFTAHFPREPFAELVKNVFIIFSWVVIWQPFQSLVFDRWTLSEQARVYALVKTMDISVRHDGHPDIPDGCSGELPTSAGPGECPTFVGTTSEHSQDHS